MGTEFKTAEGKRPIFVIKIANNAKISNDPKKEDILITGCHHARESITTEFCLQLAKDLVDHKDQPNVFPFEGVFKNLKWNVADLLDRAEILIVSVLNPDGYGYTRTPGNFLERPGGAQHINRRWRKNRRDLSTQQAVAGKTQAGGPGAIGVDLNRNYPAFWDPPRNASDDPFAWETYRGPDRGSEVENQAIRRLHDQFNIVGVMNYHSHRGTIIFAFSHRNEPIPQGAKNLLPGRVLDDSSVFIELSELTCRFAVQGGTQYPSNRSSQLFPLISGEADDWAYSEKRRLSVTVELNLTAGVPGEDVSQSNAFQPANPRPLSRTLVLHPVFFAYAMIDRNLRNKPRLVDGLGRKDK